MSKQVQALMAEAMANGDDVVVDIKAHLVSVLRDLADGIESGAKQVGTAEIMMSAERAPYFTYVLSIKE